MALLKLDSSVAHRSGMMWIAAALALVFVGFATGFTREFSEFFAALGRFTFVYFGWFYVLTVSGLLIFLLWIAASRYGDLRLGREQEPAQYSLGAWFAMLFAAGIGTVLMFWGVAEPLSHFIKPPFLDIEPNSRDAAKAAMNVSLYHFGLHTWTIFTLPALAIAFFSYRQDLPLRVSSVFVGFLGERIRGPLGRSIDLLALLGTLFGVAVSVGLGTLQLASGASYLSGSDSSLAWQLVIVALVVLVATASVALGLDKGIKRLSYFNIGLALVLLAFIWVLGPTLFITSGSVQNLGIYVQNLPWMSFWTEAYQGTSWQQGWTVFYWAWTISWAPYVGLFIARISRGRTVRQLVYGALGAPFLFTLMWFSVFGLSAIDLQMQGVDLASQVEADVSIALFSFLQSFPLSTFTSVLSLIIILVFLTTSADSAALVMDSLSHPTQVGSSVWHRVFWMLLLGAVAASLLLGGGLKALQEVITALGFPFCLLLVAMAVALVRELRQPVPPQSIASGAEN